MASQLKAYGVTPPLSTDPPTEKEIKSHEALIEELRRRNNFESVAETEKRKEVLKQIEEIGHEFVRRVAASKEDHNERLIKDARCRVFTYGSYRLGVHSPGSDIDTLVVGPKYCNLDHFFEYMPDCLRELAPPGAITSLAPVPDAFVPIIKMVYSGIEIDLIYASIATLKQLPSDPSWSMQDDNLLRGLNETEVRALNGTRVNDEIIALVPEPSTFRLALRAIKLWAQSRGIYGNIVGFPGGIAWALMVARVCQLLPRAPSSVVVAKLFSVMYMYPFPQPVALKYIETGSLQLPVWNPKGSWRDGTALMPILTPAYPSMNSTYNITQSTFSIIKKELARGRDIAAQILDGSRPWKDLFDKHTFFTQDYRYYIQVTTLGVDKDSLKEWSGWVESRLRFLVAQLEQNPFVKLAHPYVKGYSRKHRCLREEDRTTIMLGSMEFLIAEEKEEEETDAKEEQVDAQENNAVPVKVETENIDASIWAHVRQEADAIKREADPEKINGRNGAVKSEKDGFEVFTKTFYIGINILQPPKTNIFDISTQTEAFRTKCEEWDRFVKDLYLKCGIGISVSDDYRLPDDLFDPDEEKPKRGSKPLMPSPADKVKKRSASGAGLEEYGPPSKKSSNFAPASATG